MISYNIIAIMLRDSDEQARIISESEQFPRITNIESGREQGQLSQLSDVKISKLFWFQSGKFPLIDNIEIQGHN